MGQIAYYELNIDYITQKYCVNKEKPQLECNGKCHLAKELNTITSDLSDENEENRTSYVLEVFSPLFLEVQSLFNLEMAQDQFSKHTFFYKNKYVSVLEYDLLKPPIV